MNLTQQQKRVIKDAAIGTPPHIFETGKYKLHPNVILSLEKKGLVTVTRLKGGLRQVELTDKAQRLITVIVKPPWVIVTFRPRQTQVLITTQHADIIAFDLEIGHREPKKTLKNCWV